MENNILMDKKEYYKPNREDFFIGYEYEYEANNPYNPENNWTKTKFSLREAGEFDEGFMIDWYLEKDKIRVPYLNKQQIEANLENSNICFIFEGNNVLTLLKEKQIVFKGICKSKNELRKILEYIR